MRRLLRDLTSSRYVALTALMLFVALVCVAAGTWQITRYDGKHLANDDLRANAHDYKQRVILPADAVQTYDMPIATAKEMGTLAHPGDFFHLVFLYHMALNGIQVVRTVEA